MIKRSARHFKIISAFMLFCFSTGIAHADTLGAAGSSSVGSLADAGAAGSLSATEAAITINFNQADIQSVFRILAMKGNVNIVAGPEIVGEVTLQLNNVPWEKAFDTIVRTYGYTYQQEGNIYRVMTPEQFSQQRLEGSKTEIFTLQYADLTQVTDAFAEAFGSNIKIEPIAGMNQFMLTETPTNLNMARKILAQIDRKLRQVLVETKIVSTRLTKEENLGIDWNVVAGLTGAAIPTTFPFAEDPSSQRLGKFLQRFDYLPQGQTASESTTTATATGATSTATSTSFPKPHSFPFVEAENFTYGTIDFSQFSAVLNMLKTRNNTKIISNPRVVTLNHQTARIQVGEDVGIPTFERNAETGAFEVTGYETRNTGIVLNVTPHISEEDEITIHVHPEVTGNVVFEAITGTNLSVPRVTTIAADTRVLVHSGDTVVIGGLIDEQESNGQEKVPYLHGIPLIGWFFKHIHPSNNRVEHIFFVTITIVDEVYNKEALKNWREKEKEFEKAQKYEEEEFIRKRQNKKKFFFF